eukprot:768726-Hanusia_phi.AAC.11
MKRAKSWFQRLQKQSVSGSAEAWHDKQASAAQEGERDGGGQEGSEGCMWPAGPAQMEELQLDETDLFQRGLNTSILQAMWFEEHALLDRLLQLHQQIRTSRQQNQSPTQRGRDALVVWIHLNCQVDDQGCNFMGRRYISKASSAAIIIKDSCAAFEGAMPARKALCSQSKIFNKRDILGNVWAQSHPHRPFAGDKWDKD